MTGLSKDGKPIFVYYFTEYEAQVVLWSHQQINQEDILKVLDKYLLDYQAQTKMVKEKEFEILSEEYKDFWKSFKWAHWPDYLKDAFGMQEFEYQEEICTNGL